MCYMCDQLAKSRFMRTLCKRLAIEDSFWFVVVISSFQVLWSMSLLDPIGYFSACLQSSIRLASLSLEASCFSYPSAQDQFGTFIWLIGIWLTGSWSISPKMGGKVASNEQIWPMGVHGSSKVCFSSSALKLISHQYYKFLVLGTSFYSNL